MFNSRSARHLASVAFLLALAFSAACEKASDGPVKLDKSKFENVDELGKVELLSTGKGAKRELRYLFQEGTSERMRMTLGVDSRTGVNGAEIDIKMGMNYVMRAQLDALVGDRATLGFVIEDFALDEAKTSPMLKQGLGALKGLLDGMRGSMQLDSRGQIHDVGYDMSSVPEAMRESLTQMQEGLKQMATSLPEEAVGVGAKWRVYQVLKTTGIGIRQQIELELVKMDGAILHLETRLAQDADIQFAEMPGLPPGARSKVMSFWSTGTGTLVIDLEGIVPVRGTSELKTKGKFSLDMGGDPVNMSMDAAISVSMQRL